MSNTTKLHGGELVVQTLRTLGVDTIFSLSGGHIAPIYDSCITHEVRVVDTRHEQAAAHMADAYAKLTGRPGVCVVTAGPGFTDALTGMANAMMSHTPMILIGGRSSITLNDRLDLQEMDQMGMVGPVTKWAKVVYDVKRLPEYVAMAYRQAMSGRPGPVYLEIPVDVLGKSIDETKVAIPDIFNPPLSGGGNQTQIDEAVELLANAKKPMMIAGSGAFYSQAGPAIEEFLGITHIPTNTAMGGRGVIPDDHPDCLGAGGAFGGGAGQADVLVLLGTRISLFLGFGKAPLMNPNTKIIQVDIHGEEIGRNHEVAVGIQGDVRQVVEQMTAAAQNHEWNHQEWSASLKGNSKAKPQFHKQRTSDKLPMHPLRLCDEVVEFCGTDSVLVSDGGEIQAWMGMAAKAYAPGTNLNSGLFGCLGVGIPYAITAKLVHPDKPVVLVTGDGAVGLMLMEWDTAVRHGVPIITVVGNDGAWGMIKHGQELSYGKDRIIGSELGQTRYDKLMEALGGYGELVEDPKDVQPALKRALDSGLPACINVYIDPKPISPGAIFLASMGAG